jgi:hypothetical protein
MATMKQAILSLGKSKILHENSNYIHAIFKSRVFGFIDDLEVTLDKKANIFQIRSASRTGRYDFDVNRKRVEKILSAYSLRGVKHTLHLLKGEAENVIPELAEKENVDLIVLGTVGRSGIPGFFIGNTAESILNQANCSVLTLKPEGFVSPITL